MTFFMKTFCVYEIIKIPTFCHSITDIQDSSGQTLGMASTLGRKFILTE